MLAFHFGVMGSGKSAFALMTAHEKHRPDAASHPNRAVLATTMDRSTDTVTSRTGMTAQAIQLLPGHGPPRAVQRRRTPWSSTRRSSSPPATSTSWRR